VAKKKPPGRGGRGGRRAGAGRKPVDPSGAMVKHTVRLTPTQTAHCEQGGGTVQEAARRLIEADMRKRAKP
jgi:hypothetical protein